MKLQIVPVGFVLIAAGCVRTAYEVPSPATERCAPACGVALAEFSPARVLAHTGGGRPGTGYVGVAAALSLPTSDYLKPGGSVDVNYTLNFAENGAVELSAGALAYAIDRDGLEGNIGTTALSAVCQLGRAFGAARWYVGLGGGYWLNEVWGMADADADPSGAGIVSAGVHLPLSVSGNLALELRYLVSRVTLSAGDDLVMDALATRVNYIFLF